MTGRLALFILLFSTAVYAEDRLLAPGVSRELALARATRYAEVRYDLRIELAPKANLLRGREEIRFKLREMPAQLVLDWRAPSPDRVRDVEVNGRAVVPTYENEHLVIPGEFLIAGENRLRLRFESPISTSGTAVTRYLDREDASEYIYTLFVPSDASTVFPCFDQPDLKARFRLEVVAPQQWEVVSNTRAQQIVPRADATKIVRFGETPPISTYLFAFAAGPFVELRDERSPFDTRLYVRRSRRARALAEKEELFRLNREALQFFARYFDHPYPFEKYDIVVVPEFAYGGMEHAGATFLREEATLFPFDPTANDLLSRAELIFHEAAHQWFGDLVTMRWFDDLWLKEGFATFMAYKATEKLLPQYNAWKAFYQRTKPAAYATDATKGTTPIYQEVPNLSAAKSAYGNIVYRKAPSMLRQAEFFLGPENFQRAVQRFIREHAFANAAWSDLVAAFERASGRRLDRWADAWVKRRGMADVSVHLEIDRRGLISRLALIQRDVLNEGGAWPMRVKVLLAYDDRVPEIFLVTLEGAGATAIPQAVGLPRPAFVFANYEDYGYGRFLLDAASREAVIARLDRIEDDFLRALLWGAVWDSVREAELAPARYIELALRLLAREHDEVTVQSTLNRVQTAFNRYLSAEQRREITPRLEVFLMDRLQRASSVGLRITYFRALQSVATTETGRGFLKKLLRGEVSVPGMTLRSRDRFSVIAALLARDDSEAPALLEQESRADMSDDARRYAYAAGAARRDAAVKRTYFAAYLNDAQLPESWIEASLPWFNFFEQADLTLPYLEPALRELPRLKQMRKIFFVNNWLAAFIGGQCSERAQSVVRGFLDNARDLDRDLRLKVLEAVDELDRCVRIKQRQTGSADDTEQEIEEHSGQKSRPHRTSRTAG